MDPDSTQKASTVLRPETQVELVLREGDVTQDCSAQVTVSLLGLLETVLTQPCNCYSHAALFFQAAVIPGIWGHLLSCSWVQPHC